VRALCQARHSIGDEPGPGGDHEVVPVERAAPVELNGAGVGVDPGGPLDRKVHVPAQQRALVASEPAAVRLAEGHVQEPRLIDVHPRVIDHRDLHVAAELFRQQVGGEGPTDAPAQHRHPCRHRRVTWPS
jgi:hypothetical protein